MKNTYEVRGDVTAIIIDSPMYGTFETLISTSKLKRAMEFPGKWSLEHSRTSNTSYVHASTRDKDGKRTMVRLHRWLTQPPEDAHVDHYNNNGLINTDDNLRILTNAENRQNLNGAYSNSKSGIRGVTWCKRERKWIAQIRVNRRTIFVGYFKDIKDAEQAVMQARAKHMPFSKEASA